MVRMIAGRLITESTEVEPGVVVVNPTVTWNPSASLVEITLKDWNRDFTEGTLAEWTYVDAEVSTEDPYEGPFCVNLTKTGAYMVQTLDEPVPVYSVYEFSAWFKRKASGDAVILEMRHTDGTVNQVGASLLTDEWFRFYFDRSEMRTDKILSAIAIISVSGDFFVDKVFLGITTDVMAGSVESLQAIPRSLQSEVIARPKGKVLESGDVTFTGAAAAWQLVADHTPDDGDRFELTKILVSCEDAAVYQLRWGGAVIGAEEVYVTGGIPFTDWFPWNYHEMEGDGSLAFELYVIDPSDASTATCYAEIVGEDVLSGFND
ncbi:MAG: hypothetical protein NWE89_03420 [Candidatus Bathyarchaeota archaeon]|nr:hypothetical protein [Candidatus Bathyarchaeota archaeon]